MAVAWFAGNGTRKSRGGPMTQKNFTSLILFIGMFAIVGSGLAAAKNIPLAAIMSSIADDIDYIAVVTKGSPAAVKSEAIQVAIVRTKTVSFLFQMIRDHYKDPEMKPNSLDGLEGAALSGKLEEYNTQLKAAQDQVLKIEPELLRQQSLEPGQRDFSTVAKLLFDLSGKNNPSSIKAHAHGEFNPHP
jgi:hypothetical protein